jgi:cob(I)alamin adenosyltransferase
MADRLTIITTRAGDDGTTSLGDGSRLPKTHIRVQALGDVDELNSQLGLLIAHLSQLANHEGIAALHKSLQPIQHALFDIGSELAIPGYKQLTTQQLHELDDLIEQNNNELPSLKEFILPGGSVAAAQAHVVRTVCRRAERALVAVHEADIPTDERAAALNQQYLNRLSDLLFIVARRINHQLNHPDVYWQNSRQQ